MFVDTFLVPVKTARKSEYIRNAETMAAVFRDHGASSVTENWGAEVPEGKVTSFAKALLLEPDETCVVAWITYPDKTTRDACMEAAMKDPRMNFAMDTLPLDPKRMIVGGFETIVTA